MLKRGMILMARSGVYFISTGETIVGVKSGKGYKQPPEGAKVVGYNELLGNLILYEGLPTALAEIEKHGIHAFISRNMIDVLQLADKGTSAEMAASKYFDELTDNAQTAVNNIFTYLYGDTYENVRDIVITNNQFK